MTKYEENLEKICKSIEAMPGTSGARALRMVVMDLEGDGGIGEILHTLDRNHFNMVIGLLVEFRETGHREAFNSIHAAARQRISIKI